MIENWQTVDYSLACELTIGAKDESTVIGDLASNTPPATTGGRILVLHGIAANITDRKE
jgi:hypothetical protein